MSKAQILYRDIGDYLSREDKLKIVKEAHDILSLEPQMKVLQPNEAGDWINQRNSEFAEFIPLEPDEKEQSFFNKKAIGVATNRDSWVFNFSKNELCKNMKGMINFYNKQIGNSVVNEDPTKISWTRALRKNFQNNIKHTFKEKTIAFCLYRPFTKQWLYYDRSFIESPGLWSQLFPLQEHKNIIICVSCVGTKNELSVLISKNISDLHFIGDTQCFPLYWYEKRENKAQGELFEKENEYTCHNAISNFILDQAKTRYGSKVTREDIFYYVYGMLHSPSYRKTYANDLKKMLPRLPLVEDAKDFWAFSKAGRNLADLHLNYEEQEKPKEVKVSGIESGNFIVSKMEFLAKDKKDTIRYNSDITISNIPAKAYEYIVNGKSAIEWIMERYAITTHKESGIKNNPNDWAIEHDNPRCILDLLLSVITVSVETVEIVDGLPGGL